MKAIVVLISWVRNSALDIVSFALNIVTKMTDNTNFPKPKVPLTELSDAAHRLEDAYASRKNGMDGKLEYEAALDGLNERLYSQASYVNDIAAGNAQIIASSGFEPSNNARVPATIPVTPNPPKVKPLGNGIMSISTDKVSGASSYLYVIFLGDDVFNITVQDDYILMPPSTIKTIIIPEGGLREDIRGLVPGTKVHVQVLAQNTAGKSPFSAMVSAFVA